jgi:poly [ADP-ribose] polymerase
VSKRKNPGVVEKGWALRSCTKRLLGKASPMFDSPGKGQDGIGGKTEKTLGDFAAEYAKSNRSTCKGCLEKIEKVRLG